MCTLYLLIVARADQTSVKYDDVQSNYRVQSAEVSVRGPGRQIQPGSAHFQFSDSQNRCRKHQNQQGQSIKILKNVPFSFS